MKSSVLFEKSVLGNVVIFITSAYVYTFYLNVVNPSVSIIADSLHFMLDVKIWLHPTERNTHHPQ